MRLFLLIAYFPPLILTAHTCYFPLGDVSGDVPCDPDAHVSLCCGSRSACLSNGICKQNDSNIGYSCGTCTDKTWTSSICPQHCQVSKSSRRQASAPQVKPDFLASDQDSNLNLEAYNFGTGGVQIWECGSKGYDSPAKYCCESAGEKTRCCSNSMEVFELAAATIGNPSSTIPSWLLPSSSSTIKPSAVSSPSGTTDTTPSSTLRQVTATSRTATPIRNNSSTGSKIGAGVGVPLGIVTMICLTYLLWHKQRNEARLKQLKKQLMPQQEQTFDENSSCHAGEPYEMPVHERPAMLGVPKDHLHELPTIERSQEIEAGGRGEIYGVAAQQ